MPVCVLTERQCEFAEVLVMVLDDEPSCLQHRLSNHDLRIGKLTDEGRSEPLEECVVEHYGIEDEQLRHHIHGREADFEVDVINQWHKERE